MRVYLASPNTQQQAEHAAGMNVLISYAIHRRCGWLDKGSWQSWASILADSGAYSEMNSGAKVDISEYRDWSEPWREHTAAIAGLDDIRGDWKRSLKNYEAIPWSFPTFHDSDPWELLPDLVAMARERKTWLGIGLVPPREGKELFVRRVCEQAPEGIPVHGWALRRYTHIRRLDSVDSTNWWRDAMKIRTLKDTEHLHYGECLEIVVKRYQRWTRVLREPSVETQSVMFGSPEEAAQ